MRLLSVILLGFLLTITTSGCSQSMSSKEMGTVVQEIPKVQGADKPYPLPQLENTATDEKTPEKQPADK